MELNFEDADIDELLEIELQQGIEPESEEELPDDDFDPLLLIHVRGGAGGQQKISDFYEEVVPELTDEQFREQFRLSRGAVRCVLDLLVEHDDGDAAIPLEKKLLLCLWYLGSVISFRKVAMVFGLSLGAAWAAVKEVVTLLVGLRDRIIAFPPKAQLEDTILRFREKGFPGVIGAVDGCHIQVSRPSENEHAYVNRKHVHAINLMAVADDAGCFMDVCVGWPGSVHDSRVFKSSPLGKKLESEQFRSQALPENSHILGDAAFQLSTYLITPFRENQLGAQNPGEPTPREKRFFNFKLSSSRVVVEHAFGRLKGRFRRLHYVETKTVQKAVDVTCAACVLHNICTGRGEDWEAERDQEGGPDRRQVDDNGVQVATDGAAAVRKRMGLVRQVWQMNAH